MGGGAHVRGRPRTASTQRRRAPAHARRRHPICIILGISEHNKAVTTPPPCALLREVGLQPAHVLHMTGLLRFWRLVLSREPTSLLRQAWEAVQSRESYMHPASVNRALRRAVASVPGVINPNDLPPAENKLRWKKEIVNRAAFAATAEWTRSKIAQWGRAAEYSYIATELKEDGPAYHQLPVYLTIDGLSKSERRNIAVFRIQATQYVATHAGFRDTELYGKRQNYHRRYCVWSECDHAIDDTAHVLLHCPLHKHARRRLLSAANAALLPLGTSLHELGSDLQISRFLLGSPPVFMANVMAESTTAYRDVLRATATFLRAVYTTRWVHPQQNGQQADGS